jgi:hypothetical protein
MATHARWQEIQEEVLRSTDVEAVFRSHGVRFVDRPANAQGWLACHAIDREDEHPSACCNVGDGPMRGRYKDSGGSHLSLNFFEFLVHKGIYTDWREARRELAKAAGITIPKGPEPDSPKSKISFGVVINSMLMDWADKKKGVTADAARLAGVRMGNWPEKAPTPHFCVIFPGWHTADPDAEPCGYVLYNHTGEPLMLYKGKTKPAEPHKVLTSASCQPCLLNKHALEYLAEAEVVWVTEGPTDMLALQAKIPPDKLNTHVVISHAHGASESIQPHWPPLFKGKTVYIPGDADLPGRLGADKWAVTLAPFAASTRAVRLPYAERDKDGLDLRDYLNGRNKDGTYGEPRTYDDLLALAASSAPPPEPPPAPVASSATPTASPASSPPAPAGGVLIEYRARLALIGLHVLGCRRGTNRTTAEVYSEPLRTIFHIPNISYYSYSQLLMDAGPVVEGTIGRTEAPKGGYTFDDIRDAIAGLASQTNLDSAEPIGQGVWLVDGHVAVVNGARACVVGDTFSFTNLPRIASRLVELSAGSEWCNFDRLQGYYDLTAGEGGREWMVSTFTTLERWCAMWSWKHPIDATVIAALLCATWVQSTWPWRPIVGITGPTASGKSSALELILARMFHGHHNLFLKPTEAAIRQTVGNRSSAIILDEFEDDDHRDKILELFRTTSRGGDIYRGSADGRGRKYGLKHIPWTAAIESGLKREADANRFIVLELDRIKREKFGKLRLPVAERITDMGLRLLACMLRVLPQALSLYEAIHDGAGLPPGIHGRIIESYSIPAAVVGALRGLDASATRTVLGHFITGKDLDAVATSDEADLVRTIMESTVEASGGQRRSVSQILHCEHTFGVFREDLERYGVAVIGDHTGPRSIKALASKKLFFNPAVVTRSLLKRTRWERLDVKQILRRIPGAATATRRCAGLQVAGVEVPAADWINLGDPAKGDILPESNAAIIARLAENTP